MFSGDESMVNQWENDVLLQWKITCLKQFQVIVSKVGISMSKMGIPPPFSALQVFLEKDRRFWNLDLSLYTRP